MMVRACRVGGLLVLALLASCGGGAVKTYAPDGKEAYIIQCKGGRYACAQQAGDLCGSRGYAILDQSGQVMAPQNSNIGAPELMIACEGAPPATIYSGESHPPPPQHDGAAVSQGPNEPK